MRIVTPLRTLVVSLALFSVINLNAGTPKEPDTTLGVVVTLPNGKIDRIAIQNNEASTRRVAPMIPMTGANGVYGVRVEPYISNGLVAVRLTALVGANATEAQGSCVRKSGSASLNRVEIGSYVIGNQGDSLQVAELERLGLPPLTLAAAVLPVVPVSSGDPCCFTADGLECCWSCSGCKTQSCFDQCQQQEAECLSVCN